MPRLLAFAGLRLLFCAAVAYVLWRSLGAVGLVVSAPLFGVLLARPVIELSGELRDIAKHLVYADVDGRNFEHRGIRLNIVEDDRHHRWISVNDVRKVIAQFPREAVLQRQFPEGLCDDQSVRGHRIQADALLAYLRKSTESDSVRFRNWLEREVVLPAAKIRQRLGIRDVVPSPSTQPPQAP